MRTTVRRSGDTFAFVTRTCILAALVQLGACAAPSASDPKCESAEEAKALGAIVMNASRPQSRLICR